MGHPVTVGNVIRGRSSAAVYVLGDSIMAGELAAPGLGCVDLLTAAIVARGGTVTSNAVSGRALYMIASTAAQRAAIAATIAAAHPTTVWCNLGVNDWSRAGSSGGTLTNIAAYTAQYVALLDAVHLAAPNARFIVQSPTLCLYPDPSPIGETLAQYRAAAAAAASRWWTTYVDGLPIIDAGDLAPDKIHPLTSGHAKLGQSMITTVN